MKILVTGASGFIGRALCSRLSNNHEVIGIDKEDTKNFPGQIFYRRDLRREKSLKKIIKGVDLIINLASPVKHPGDKKSFKEGVEITSNLLEVAAESKVSEIIFISSLSVFNLPLLRNKGEKEIKIENYYEKEKLASEEICQAYARKYNIDLTIIRPAMVYDFSEPSKEVNLLSRLVDIGFVPTPGPADNILNVISRDKVVEKIESIVKSDFTGTVEFKGESVTLNQFLDRISKARGEKFLQLKLPFSLLHRVLPLLNRVFKFLDAGFYLSESRLRTIENSR